MKIGILAGALLCALVSAPSIAQTMPPKPQIGGHGDNVQAFIAEFDTDGDGRVTRAEFERFRRTRFDATDTNHDGSLIEAEYVQEFANRLHAQLESEIAAQLKQTDVRFDALDTDKDGTVSRSEFDVAGEKTWLGGQRALADRDKKDGTVMPDRAGRSPGLLSMPTSHSAEGFLALYDTDGDGKVSRAEYDEDRAAQFARSDRNHDGELDREEYAAEYRARIDARAAELDKREDRQAHVRFGVLDTDKDRKMTFVEYQASGKRLFDTADRNRDGVIDAADARLPPPRARGRFHPGRRQALTSDNCPSIRCNGDADPTPGIVVGINPVPDTTPHRPCDAFPSNVRRHGRTQPGTRRPAQAPIT